VADMSSAVSDDIGLDLACDSAWQRVRAASRLGCWAVPRRRAADDEHAGGSEQQPSCRESAMVPRLRSGTAELLLLDQSGSPATQ
jgi:hypothetical protein